MNLIPKTCANRNNDAKCERHATPGHIYCTNCRVANGGYHRYIPQAPNKAHSTSY